MNQRLLDLVMHDEGLDTHNITGVAAPEMTNDISINIKDIMAEHAAVIKIMFTSLDVANTPVKVNEAITETTAEHLDEEAKETVLTTMVLFSSWSSECLFHIFTVGICGKRGWEITFDKIAYKTAINHVDKVHCLPNDRTHIELI